MLTTARLADRMPATYRVRIGPSCQKTSPIWVAMPTGPATGGGCVGSVATELDELAEAAQDQPEGIDRPLARRSAIASGNV